MSLILNYSSSVEEGVSSRQYDECTIFDYIEEKYQEDVNKYYMLTSDDWFSGLMLDFTDAPKKYRKTPVS